MNFEKDDQYEKNMFKHSEDESETKKIRDAAFRTALDVRKFEIELYWKRGGYFWTFIAATFAGFSLVISSKIEPAYLKFDIAYFLCLFGIVTSWIWYLVLKASKFWQENWEAHVDYLEDEFQGRLYKNVKRIKNPSNYAEKFFLGPYPYSVTKLNILLGLFVFACWLAATAYLITFSIEAGGFNDVPVMSKAFRIIGGFVTLLFVTTASDDCKTTNFDKLITEDGRGFFDREGFSKESDIK